MFSVIKALRHLAILCWESLQSRREQQAINKKKKKKITNINIMKPLISKNKTTDQFEFSDWGHAETKGQQK